MGNQESNPGHDMRMNEMDHGKQCDCIQNAAANCLHRAVKEMNKEKVQEMIIQSEGSCLLDRNCDSEIPLHLACKDDRNSEIVKILLGIEHMPESQNINFKKKLQLEAENEIFGNTPLHVAACIGCTKIARIILNDRDIDPLSLIQKQNKLKDTPVHNAASRGHVGILEEMHSKGGGRIFNKGRFRGQPLHSACGYGRLEAAKKLLEWDRSQMKKISVRVNLPAFTKTTESRELDPMKKEEVKKTIESLSESEQQAECHREYTPLTRACQFGHKHIVEYLLDEGDEPHPMALVKAIEGLYTECVELLLFKKEFRKQLLHHTYIPDGSSVSTTPFRELIKHIPGVAESVLHRCVELERFLVNSETFKIRLNYEFVDDDGENWMRDNINRLSGVKIEDHSSDETDYDIPTQKIGFNKETHPLSLMIEHKREKLLTHPVVAALIHDKWKSVYGAFSLIQWLVYVLFLGCMTALLCHLPNPRSGLCERVHADIMNTSQQENSSCSSMPSSNNTSDSVDCDGQYDGNTTTLFGLASVIILYSVIRIPFELYQFVRSTYQACYSLKRRGDTNFCLDVLSAFRRIDYIWSLNNWIEVPLFMLSLIFAFVIVLSKDNMFCVLAWQWQIGVIVIWLSWIEFIFLSTQFRLIGVHALMFIRVLTTIVKFIPLALLLIIAFGLTFHFLLYQPEVKASPYFTPGYSFLKTLSMTTGDVDSDTFFGLDINGQARSDSHLQYLQLSTFVWLLSLLFMTILLSNLLIGLAVGDIQTIYEKAHFEKLKLQVDYVLTAESQSPRCLRKLGNKSYKEFEPNKKSFGETVKKELIYLIWGGVRYESPESIERLIFDKSVKK